MWPSVPAEVVAGYPSSQSLAAIRSDQFPQLADGECLDLTAGCMFPVAALRAVAGLCVCYVIR